MAHDDSQVVSVLSEIEWFRLGLTAVRDICVGKLEEGG